MADANVLIAVYLRDSTVRRIILFADLQLLVPGFIFEELEKHLPDLSERARLETSESNDLLTRLRSRFAIIPQELVSTRLRGAHGIMGNVDPNDVPYLAAALCVPCDGIWSDDPHLKTQDHVKCYSTGELLERIRREGYPSLP